MPKRDGSESGTAVLNRPVGGETLTDQVNGLAGDSGTDTDAENSGTDAGEGGAAETGATEAASAAKAPKRNLDDAPDDEVVGITLRVPNGFRKLMAAKAMEQKPATSVPQMLAEMAAEAFGYKLPKPERAPRLKKYDSPEERKEAQKRDQRRQRLIAQKTLEAVERGEIQIDTAALLAEVEKELAEKEAADKVAASANAATATATATTTTEGAPETDTSGEGETE